MKLTEMRGFKGTKGNACYDKTSVENGYWKCHNMPDHSHETLCAQFQVGEDQKGSK
jgi:hypothetical protein